MFDRPFVVVRVNDLTSFLKDSLLSKDEAFTPSFNGVPGNENPLGDGHAMFLFLLPRPCKD